MCGAEPREEKETSNTSRKWVRKRLEKMRLKTLVGIKTSWRLGNVGCKRKEPFEPNLNRKKSKVLKNQRRRGKGKKQRRYGKM